MASEEGVESGQKRSALVIFTCFSSYDLFLESSLIVLLFYNILFLFRHISIAEKKKINRLFILIFDLIWPQVYIPGFYFCFTSSSPFRSHSKTSAHRHTNIWQTLGIGMFQSDLFLIYYAHCSTLLDNHSFTQYLLKENHHHCHKRKHSKLAPRYALKEWVKIGLTSSVIKLAIHYEGELRQY